MVSAASLALTDFDGDFASSGYPPGPSLASSPLDKSMIMLCHSGDVPGANDLVRVYRAESGTLYKYTSTPDEQCPTQRLQRHVIDGAFNALFPLRLYIS